MKFLVLIITGVLWFIVSMLVLLVFESSMGFGALLFTFLIYAAILSTRDPTFIIVWGQSATVFFMIVAIFFSFLASEANPSYPFSVSQHGYSSCTAKTGVNAVYNPHGSSYPGPLYTYCPYRTSRWADLQGIPPVGYNATAENIYKPNVNEPCVDSNCAFLATTDKKDYTDRGSGLTNGFATGVTITDVFPCPGVNMLEFNQYGRFGKGRVICATCSKYLSLYNGYTEGAQCEPGASTVFCHLCVEPSLRQSPWQITAVAIVFVVFALICQLFMCVYCSLSLRKPKQLKM
jgi:hypothetical protein